jgi:peptide deformylase
MKLVYENNPILKAETLPFDFDQDVVDPEELILKMAKTMRQANGIKVFVIDIPWIIACFNPKIIEYSEKQILLPEGCLSFPNLYMSIWRPEWIEAEWQTYNGKTKTRRLNGLSGRIFQHEFDHLNGVLFTSKAKPVALRMGRQKQRKTNKKKVYA